MPKGERATAAHPHRFLSNVRVRKTLSMVVDGELLVEVGYGQAGHPSCHLVPGPAIYALDNTDCLVQDIEGAKALLEEAGYKVGPDGIRVNDAGVRLSLLYQPSVNAVRQDFQDLIKQWWNEIGAEVDLRQIDGGVFFDGDAGSPDTFQKFHADVEIRANNLDGTDPEAYLAAYTCDNVPRPETQWQGENINRFCDPAHDALIVELGRTGDLAKRGEIAKKLNDMLSKENYTIVPLVDRGRSSAHSNSLGGVMLNSWDSELWNIADWYRIR